MGLSTQEVAAELLDIFGERGELRMDYAATEVARRLDGGHGLTPPQARQVRLLVAEACNLLERCGAACRRPDSTDHRELLITMRGQGFAAGPDPAAALGDATPGS